MRLKSIVGLLIALAACRGERLTEPGPPSSSTIPELGLVRGVILISLDTLRADRLGAYGYEGATSPFLDRLAAERGLVFERVVAQYPGTLISHMSMLTGLYPQEHGVLPPASVLALEVPLLAEMLSARGALTAGHTEGGFVDGDFGFSRGFEVWTDTAYSDDRDIERTLGRGVEFLRRVPKPHALAIVENVDQPFFLFLHTYSIHDPYTPPPDYGFDSGDALEPPPTGETLKLANDGFIDVPQGIVEEYSARYDASIRYVDEVLRGFFDDLRKVGLLGQTAVIITSDHGEAFGEHGRLGHEQTYPEELHVPLILIHPDLDRGYRVPTPVELIDVAPTVLDLLGVDSETAMSGRSLLGSPIAGAVHAENADPTRNRVHLEKIDEVWWMLVETEYLADPDGAWLPLDHAFDVDAPASFEVVAFNGPKAVSVVVDGQLQEEVEVGGTWTAIEVDGQGRRRVNLVTDGCTSPQRLGVGDDPRCLSLKLRGAPPRRLELFDLTADPGASQDLSRRQPQRLRRMLSTLNERRFEPRAVAGDVELDGETRKTLETLGYL